MWKRFLRIIRACTRRTVSFYLKRHSLLVCIKNPAHPIPLTVLLDVEPRLVDDDSPVSGEDLHGDPQGSNEDEKPNGETQRRHQQRALVEVEAETAPPQHLGALGCRLSCPE